LFCVLSPGCETAFSTAWAMVTDRSSAVVLDWLLDLIQGGSACRGRSVPPCLVERSLWDWPRLNGPKCRSCVGDSESVAKRDTSSWDVTRAPGCRNCWIAPGVCGVPRCGPQRSRPQRLAKLKALPARVRAFSPFSGSWRNLLSITRRGGIRSCRSYLLRKGGLVSPSTMTYIGGPPPEPPKQGGRCSPCWREGGAWQFVRRG
jgi:hypothetical protein